MDRHFRMSAEQWSAVRAQIKPGVEAKLRELKLSCQVSSDIVQSALGVFIAGESSLSSVEHPAEPSGVDANDDVELVADTVLRIAWEKCQVEYRRSRRKVDGALTNRLDAPSIELRAIQAATQDDSASLVNRMLHTVDHLADVETRILMRCLVLGFSQRETAEILGCSESKVSRTKQAAASAIEKEHIGFLSESRHED